MLEEIVGIDDEGRVLRQTHQRVVGTAKRRNTSVTQGKFRLVNGSVSFTYSIPAFL